MQEVFQLFTVLIAKLCRNIKRIKTAEMEEFDLKSPHLTCLHYIYNYGGQSIKQLCNISEEDKASISRSVDYLEQVGLVYHTSAKKYKNPIELTEKGEEIGKTISRKLDVILEFARAGITDEEATVMYRCLRTISDNLEKINDKYDK